ncbi:hypothetical protein ACFLQZ_03200 [Acidobacteriota bacterium]
MSKHPFHLIIGELVDDTVRSRKNYSVVRDPACVEKNGHNLPLFYKGEKSSATEFTDVDILILNEDKKTIKVIIEIEESNVKPLHIFGKVFAAASCSHYIYGEDKYEMNEKILFIQVLESKQSEKSKKPEQWKHVEDAIKNILPVQRNRFLHYKLIFGDSKSFLKEGEKREELDNYILKYL